MEGHISKMGKNILIGITVFLGIICFACIDETIAPEEEPIVVDDKVQLELFTRIDPYKIPESRSSANEDGVDMTPWVLVFKGNDMKFMEAAQALEISSTNKRYVILTKQDEACKLLILANPQARFYMNATQSYTFSSGTFATALLNMSLDAASQALCTEPLSNPQTSIPFANLQLLPMSHVIDLPGGINKDTKIGSDAQQLEMLRVVARVEVIDQETDFDFKGITMVANAAKQGLLYKQNGNAIAPASNRVEYRYDNSYSDDIAKAVVNGTEQATTTNPVYLYEASTAYDMYIIVRGIYDGKEYFYKLAFIDEDENPLNIERNHRYIFTITKVKGPGYSTVGDAKVSLASNTQVDYTITVRDEASYEIISNNDYYMGVSNSHYIVYTDDADLTREYHAFTLATDCIRPFPDKRTITASTGLKLSSPAAGTSVALPIVTNTSPLKTEVKIQLAAGFSTGTVQLELGNLEKTVSVERRARLGNIQQILSFPEFYCLSAYVEEDDAKTWLKLVPNSEVPREVTDQIIVEDGIIKIRVERNNSGYRFGTIYLTTIKDPGLPTSQIIRIKIYIKQREVINV